MGILHPREQNFHPAKCSTILNRLNIWEQANRGKLSELENTPSCVLTRAKWAWSMLREQNPSCVSTLKNHWVTLYLRAFASRTLQRKKAIFRFTKNQALFFPKNLTLYWAPKKEQEQENKFGFHGFQYKGAVNYQHNYRTQTLSSNFWHVAGTSQVNTAYNEKSSSKGLDK